MCKWAFKISGPRAHSVGINLQISTRKRLAAVHVNDNDTVCDCEYPTARKTIKLNSPRACVVCSVWGGLVNSSIAANRMVHSWSKRAFHQNLGRRLPHGGSAQVHTRTCYEFGITSSPASEKAEEKSDDRLRLGGAGPRGHLYKSHYLVGVHSQAIIVSSCACIECKLHGTQFENM